MSSKHYEREITNWIIYTTESRINGPEKIIQFKHNNSSTEIKGCIGNTKQKHLYFLKRINHSYEKNT